MKNATEGSELPTPLVVFPFINQRTIMTVLALANIFRARFKGARFNPAGRGRGPRWFERRDPTKH
jgi:hypothetical protein